MAKVEGRALLTATITVALTESEAEALNAIVSYGDTEFLKVFYEYMGRAYLEPHEAGLRSLFHSIRDGECVHPRCPVDWKNIKTGADPSVQCPLPWLRLRAALEDEK